jgi:hypothetical protein
MFTPLQMISLSILSVMLLGFSGWLLHDINTFRRKAGK